MFLLLLASCHDFESEAIPGECGPPTLVTWSTNEPASSKVEFGMTEAYGQVTPRGDDLVTEHAVLVVGLYPSTDYHLRAVSVTADGTRLEGKDLLVTTPALDPDLPTIYPETSAPEASTAPALVTLVGGTSALMIVDAAGVPIWWRDLPPSWVGAQAYLSADGTEVIFNVADAEHLDPAVSEVHRQTLDCSSDIRTPTSWGHHDFVVLEDGSYAYIKADFREHDAEDDGDMDTVVGDAIVEVAVDGTVIREVWNAWDWLPVTVTEETTTTFYPDALDWTHMNGLWVTDDAYYVSSHSLSSIFKIDRATGDLVWRIGKRESDFTFEDGAESFSDQHSPRWVNGHLVLFNNTDTTESSYAVEYELDETTMTAREVRRYDRDGKTYSYVLGSVDVLDNDHWLVAWGTSGVVEEVDADNEVVRSFSSGIGQGVGNVHYTPELGGPLPAGTVDPILFEGSGCGCTAGANAPIAGWSAFLLALTAGMSRRARGPDARPEAEPERPA